MPELFVNYGFPPTMTPTITPTPTPTSVPVEVCYSSEPGEDIYVYRIDIDDSPYPSAGGWYTTIGAEDSPLIHVTSPPAPQGWNQPDFVPDSSWQLGLTVESPFWRGGAPWNLPDSLTPIGLWDKNGEHEFANGTTHLLRHTLTLSPPGSGMKVSKVNLEMWSDNVTEWWWQGASVFYGEQGHIGKKVELDAPAQVAYDGGTYVLAIQNSNDRRWHTDDVNGNPHGTAWKLCVTWIITGY